jgi:hypothetical protein
MFQKITKSKRIKIGAVISISLVAMLLLFLPVGKSLAQTRNAENAITPTLVNTLFLGLVKDSVELFKEATGSAINVVSRLNEASNMSIALKRFTPFSDVYDRKVAYANTITIDLLWSNAGGKYSLQSVAVNTSDVNPSLFSNEALKAFRDSVLAHPKEQGIALKSEITVTRTILAAAERLKGSFTGVQLQVLNGKERIKQGGVALITDAPAMPNIKVKPVVNETISDKKVELRLKIAYQRDGKETDSNGGGKIPNVRDDASFYPANGWRSQPVNEEWGVDFGNHIRGGTAYLLCRYNGKTDTTRFYIRGTNPKEADIKSYINQQGYMSRYWFLVKMTRIESSMRQFGQGKSYSFTKLTGTSNASGEPLYGKPRGFGLKQLDNWGKDNPQYATEQHLWSWKANIDGGVEVIKEKEADVKKAKAKNDKTIREWNDNYPTKKVSDSLYIEKGTGAGTTVLTITEGNTTTFAVNPIGTQKDVYDARWIKSFNSGKAALYYQVVGGSDAKPRRVVNRTNNVNKNYVDDVCRQPD